MRADMCLWSKWKKLIFSWSLLEVLTKFCIEVYVQLNARLKTNPLAWLPGFPWVLAPRRQHPLPTNQQKGPSPHCEQPVTVWVFWGQRDLQIRHPDRGWLSHFNGSVKQCPVRTKLLSLSDPKIIRTHLRPMWKTGCHGLRNTTLNGIHLITVGFWNWIFPVI